MDKKLLVKSFVRTAVDGCFLPGTTIGAELMFLWLVKAKKEISTIALAVLSIMFSNFDLPSQQASVINRQSSEQES